MRPPACIAGARRPRSIQGGPLVLSLLLPALLQATLPPALHAQNPHDRVRAEVERLSRELAVDRRAHLRRVGIWGGLNLLGGVALAATGEAGSTRRAFGIQSAGWGAVNTGIAAWGLLRAPGEPANRLAQALEEEDGYLHLLLVNLGLNVSYAAVGTTLLVAADRGLDGRASVRGHGAALVAQGLGLLALDLVAWMGSRRRVADLRALVPAGVEPGPVAGSRSVTLLSLPLAGWRSSRVEPGRARP